MARSASLGKALLVCLLTQATSSFADKLAPAAGGTDTGTAAPPILPPKLELEGPEADAKERARVLFQEGVAAYRDGKFYDAVAIFLQTQRVYPDTQLCFNIARAYENLGNGSAALRYYRDYLRQADRPSDGAEVRERVRRLEQQLAQRGVQQLTVISQPEAATVLLDGKPVGIAPWTGETYPGKHRLALTLRDYAVQERVVEVEAHAASDISLVLSPLPGPVSPEPAPLPVKAKQPGARLETLLTLGIGAALLGTALAAEAASSQPGISRPASFFAGGGLGVASVGTVMLYFDLTPRTSVPGALPRKDAAHLLP